MSEAASSAHQRIVVDRWRNTFVVPDADSLHHTPIYDVMERISRALTEELPRYCPRFSSALDHAADGVWLIRQLRLDFMVDVSQSGADEIAAHWSERFCLRLAEVMERGPDCDAGILYFANRAAYITQFVLDVIAGRAWTKWYYQEFVSLEMLSTSRAIGEALTREPQNGLRAIVHLASVGRLDEISAAITAADARLIYYNCFDGAPFSDGFTSADFAGVDAATRSASRTSGSAAAISLWAGRLLEVWRDAPLGNARATQTRFHQALRWLGLMAARFPGIELDSDACRAVEGLIELQHVVEEMRSPIAADRLVRDLVEARISLTQAVELARSRGTPSAAAGLQFLLTVAQGDGDWSQQAVAVLLKQQLATSAVTLAEESVVSQFAGVFLFGPALVRWNDFLQQVVGQGKDAEDVASFLRYIILLKCVGSARMLDATSDIGLRWLSGCLRASLRDGREACPSFDGKLACELLCQNLPALLACDGGSLLVETIVIPGSRKEVLLLRDVVRNEWIFGALLESHSGLQTLLSALELVGAATGKNPTVLLHPRLAERYKSPLLPGRCERVITLEPDSWSDEVSGLISSTQSVAGALTTEKYVQWLGSAEREWDYFSCAHLWPEDDFDLELFGTLLARASMREFSRHLLGFQSSGPEHLYRNFVEGVGAVRTYPERIEVELGRSPLLLVLQLSGLTRQSYTLSWLEGKEVCLLPPKE